eukprot:s861_g15.t2
MAHRAQPVMMELERRRASWAGDEPSRTVKNPDICLLLGTTGRSNSRKENDWTAPKTTKVGPSQGSMGKAVQIANAKGFDRVVKAFKGRFFAKSALASRMCKRNEVLKLARTVAGGRSVLPLSKDTVEGVAAALKEAQMKSGAQYLNELKLLHIEAGYEIEAWLKRCFDLCRKSLERNRGPTKRAAEVRVDAEATKKRGKMVSQKGMPQHIGLCFLWAAIWMLREIEVRNMKVKDVLINEEEKWTAIKIPVSKCDQQGEGVRRTLRCCGSTPCQAVCPVSLAKTVVTCAKAKSLTTGLPLFTDHKGLYVNKRGVVTGWKTTFGKQVSGHSARRSGAMYYVRNGLAIQELAFLGRWKSSVVLSYAEEALQETPMGIARSTAAGATDKVTAVVKGEGVPSSRKVSKANQPDSLEKAFDKPRDLWVVTKGKGWRSRPRHLVTKASWNLPIKEWSTACGWLFAQQSAEFYFVHGREVDKEKCSKCQSDVLLQLRPATGHAAAAEALKLVEHLARSGQRGLWHQLWVACGGQLALHPRVRPD